MAVFPTGAQARERSQGNNTLVQQIAIMEVAVLNAIASGTFTASITDSSTVTIQGTTITGSPMTDNDTDGQNYYKAYQGTITDNVKTEQMNEVIAHFENLGYTISRIKHTHVDPTQTGDGSTTAFTLSFTPASTASVTATVAGNSSALSLSGNTATFTTAPGDGEAIIFSVADNVFKWKVVWA